MTEYEHFTEMEEFLEMNPPKTRLFGNTRVKSSHWANGIVGCKRKQAFQFIGSIDEEPMSMSGQFVVDIGESVEKTLTDRFIGARIFDAREESIQFQDPSLKYNFSMRMDLLITLPKHLDPDQMMRPCEVKSMGPGMYFPTEYGGFGGKPPTVFPGANTEPKDDYLNQCTLYMKAMGLDWSVLFCLDRDTGHYTIYKVKFSQERYDGIIAHCKSVEDGLEVYAKTGELPERIIDDFPIAIYKRKTLANEIGDPKLDKSRFPCIWKNKKTGKTGACSFFAECWKKELEDLDLTMEDVFAGKKL